MPKIRVVLADDHPEMIEKVRLTLGEEFEIIDAVADGNQAIKAVLPCNRYFHARSRRALGREIYPEQ